MTGKSFVRCDLLDKPRVKMGGTRSRRASVSASRIARSWEHAAAKRKRRGVWFADIIQKGCSDIWYPRRNRPVMGQFEKVAQRAHPALTLDAVNLEGDPRAVLRFADFLDCGSSHVLGHEQCGHFSRSERAAAPTARCRNPASGAPIAESGFDDESCLHWMAPHLEWREPATAIAGTLILYTLTAGGGVL
jgi:hypothetical protein